MNEQLLHYAWRHRIYPLQPLYTTGGLPLEVVDPGLPNRNAGPDFFNAKVKLDGTLWVGNVEVHLRSSDWQRHGHHLDKAYDNVVLHVVGEADCDVTRTDGVPIPQLVLPCPPEVEARYADLCRAGAVPPCCAILPSLPRLTVHSWLSALQAERLGQKAEDIGRRLELCGGSWEDAFFVTLARNFGFGLNGDAFEAWAMRLPLRAVDKHRDSLFQVEAFFLGMAGLLDGADDYCRRLQGEFRYLSHKFQLPDALDDSRWRLLRLRPGNFPHVRLAQLAWLYHTRQSLFSRVMEAATPQEARELLRASTSEYWQEHFTFRKASPRRAKTVGRRALDLLLINTVVPFLYAYGRHKADDALCERAGLFLESLGAEDNYVTRLWDGAGIPVTTAADSQALLQLQKQYCDRRDCLRCRFGYEYLKKGKTWGGR